MDTCPESVCTCGSHKCWDKNNQNYIKPMIYEVKPHSPSEAHEKYCWPPYQPIEKLSKIPEWKHENMDHCSCCKNAQQIFAQDAHNQLECPKTAMKQTNSFHPHVVKKVTFEDDRCQNCEYVTQESCPPCLSRDYSRNQYQRCINVPSCQCQVPKKESNMPMKEQCYAACGDENLNRNINTISPNYVGNGKHFADFHEPLGENVLPYETQNKTIPSDIDPTPRDAIYQLHHCQQPPVDNINAKGPVSETASAFVPKEIPERIPYLSRYRYVEPPPLEGESVSKIDYQSPYPIKPNEVAHQKLEFVSKRSKGKNIHKEEYRPPSPKEEKIVCFLEAPPVVLSTTYSEDFSYQRKEKPVSQIKDLRVKPNYAREALIKSHLECPHGPPICRTCICRDGIKSNESKLPQRYVKFREGESPRESIHHKCRGHNH